jgi:hypothetical protein
MWTPESDKLARAEEAKTHRHLKVGERWKNGDWYGGDDWNFKFVVGTRDTSAKEGDKIHPQWMCYRPKRPL